MTLKRSKVYLVNLFLLDVTCRGAEERGEKRLAKKQINAESEGGRPGTEPCCSIHRSFRILVYLVNHVAG